MISNLLIRDIRIKWKNTEIYKVVELFINRKEQVLGKNILKMR